MHKEDVEELHPKYYEMYLHDRLILRLLAQRREESIRLANAAVPNTDQRRS